MRRQILLKEISKNWRVEDVSWIRLAQEETTGGPLDHDKRQRWGILITS